MNNLHKALGDISDIRREMARSTQFRGYGAATMASTAVLAVLAAAVQSTLLSHAANRLLMYVGLWVVTAMLSLALTGAEMYARTRRIHSGLSDEMIHLAVEQFLPALAAGVLLTVALVFYVPSVAWMLPGLWQVIFSVGIFSSCRFLPRAMHAAGAWYMLAGLVCITLGDVRALAPWTMGAAFGVGQLLVACVLFTARSEDEEDA